MAQTITLTEPVASDDLTAAYPRSTRGMSATEIETKLRILERALRSTYCILDQSSDCDSVLADAMIAAWPSFLVQLEQVASKQTSPDSHAVRYATASTKFDFPAIIGTMLGDYVDVDAVGAPPSTTKLERC